MSANTAFPSLLERFFTERLMQHKRASGHTLASYRDTFCLLLRYAEEHGIDAQVTSSVDDELASFTFPERLPESLVDEITALDEVEVAVVVEVAQHRAEADHVGLAGEDEDLQLAVGSL
mgnify:CR=1 FL=1